MGGSRRRVAAAGSAVSAANDDHQVDLVIAVHTTTRPIGRAVRSALAASERARVTVVCHDITPDEIAAVLGEVSEHPRVRLVEHRDGVRSPSGPFNAGLDAATAPWVAIMGSDDELEPGAIDDWLARAAETDADVVLPTIVRRGARDRIVATPPSRFGRDDRLDGVADRLAYRSAPLGLLRRDAIGTVRFGTGIATGEDVLVSARLFFGELNVTRHRGAAYVVHDDAGDRVTLAPRTVDAALAFVDDVIDSRWFRAQPLAVRRSIVVKTLRVNVLGQFAVRPHADDWPDTERQALHDVIVALEASAPGALDRLSRADRDLLDALDPASGASVDRVVQLATRRGRYGTPATLAPRRLRLVFDTEAPARMMLASWLTVRRDRRARRRRAVS